MPLLQPKDLDLDEDFEYSDEKRNSWDNAW